MINIERPTQSPASLQTQEIRNYINDVVNWQNDANLPKPSTAPSYRNSDLIEAFDDYFFAKCYLTEKKFVSAYEMDIEHFLPKNFNESPELRYEWTNLYPADHDANMMKPRISPKGGYLDPCHADDDVENEILYWLDFDGQACHFKAKNTHNVKAINTANLLNRLHNGHDTPSHLKTAGLRKALFDKRDLIYKTIIRWQKAVIDQNRQEEMRQEIKIRQFLSRKSSFTMLMRSTTVVRVNVPHEFLD